MRRVLWFALGLVLLAVGVTLALTSRASEPGDFGWFAYTPLTDEHEYAESSMGWADGGPAYLVSRGTFVGLGLAGLGLLVLIGGLAYLWGRRAAVRSA